MNKIFLSSATCCADLVSCSNSINAVLNSTVLFNTASAIAHTMLSSHIQGVIPFSILYSLHVKSTKRPGSGVHTIKLYCIVQTPLQKDVIIKDSISLVKEEQEEVKEEKVKDTHAHTHGCTVCMQPFGSEITFQLAVVWI